MNRKICLSTSDSFGISEYEQLKAFKKAGFDGFFTMFLSREHIAEMRSYADELGLYFQSIHAEFRGMCDFWKEGEVGEKVTQNLLETVSAAAEFNVPLVIMHAYIGWFFSDEKPTNIGLERFGRIVAVAEKCGVKIAVENTEGEEFFAAMLDTYQNKNVGFCWDTGHEMCYRTRKTVEKYISRLFGTHINDNLGVRTPDGKIYWTDDLHLLPFDGIADWERNAHMLKNFDGELTAELKFCDESDCPEHDYRAMKFETYLAEVITRLRKIETMIK